MVTCLVFVQGSGKFVPRAGWRAFLLRMSNRLEAQGKWHWGVAKRHQGYGACAYATVASIPSATDYEKPHAVRSFAAVSLRLFFSFLSGCPPGMGSSRTDDPGTKPESVKRDWQISEVRYRCLFAPAVCVQRGHLAETIKRLMFEARPVL